MSNITIGMMMNRISATIYKMMHSFFVCISCRSDKVVNVNAHANMTHLLFVDEELLDDGGDNGRHGSMVTGFI